MKLNYQLLKKITKKQLLNLIREAYIDSLGQPLNDPYVEGDELIGQRVWVHTNRSNRNLDRNGMIGIYSTNEKGNKTGSPIGYTNAIRLKNAEFFASDRGTARISNTGKRTLVAGVSGDVVSTNEESVPPSGFMEVSFNPFLGLSYFWLTRDDELLRHLSGLASSAKDPRKKQAISKMNPMTIGGGWNLWVKGPVTEEVPGGPERVVAAEEVYFAPTAKPAKAIAPATQDAEQQTRFNVDPEYKPSTKRGPYRPRQAKNNPDQQRLVQEVMNYLLRELKK